MYEIIDETLKLASCNINDLTLEEASSFLSQWEDGAKLGTLTLFFNRKTGYLVLNKDNGRYEFYLKLAKAYLSVSSKELEEYRNKFSDRLEETFRVMDDFKEYKDVQNELDIISYQHCGALRNQIAKNVLFRLEEEQMPKYFLISQAYSYGVMNGKRTERAKRKKGGAA